MIQSQETLPEPNSLLEIVQQITKPIPQSVYTYCCDLMREFLKDKSEHFERGEIHYDANGLNVFYKCNIDGRRYRVHISTEDR